MKIRRDLIASAMISLLERAVCATHPKLRRQPCRGRAAQMAILLAGSIALCTINAGAQEIRMRADVPFDFRVQDKIFEAGSYWIQVHRQATAAGGFHKQLEILSASPQSHVDAQFILAAGTVYRPRSRAGKGSKGILVFNNYRGVYALRNIWEAREAAGCIVPMSKVERELARIAKDSIEVAVQ